jgi:hypothetical protein
MIGASACKMIFVFHRTVNESDFMNHQQDKKWSAKLTQQSNALDLDEGVFTWKDPLQIAISLKHSAEKCQRRKSSFFRSAMSMLVNLY